MEQENKKIRKSQNHSDRITLSTDTNEHLNIWLEQLSHEMQGIRIKKSDLINWCVTSQSQNLNRKQIASLRSQFFDEVKFAEWALQQIKSAKDSGQNLTLRDLISVNQRNKEDIRNGNNEISIKEQKKKEAEEKECQESRQKAKDDIKG